MPTEGIYYQTKDSWLKMLEILIKGSTGLLSPELSLTSSVPT